MSGIGRRYVQALRIGNQPNMYRKFAWYRTHAGDPVRGWPRSYGLTAFTGLCSQMRSLLGAIPLAGPTVGDYAWLKHLRPFLAAQPTLGAVTF